MHKGLDLGNTGLVLGLVGWFAELEQEEPAQAKAPAPGVCIDILMNGPYIQGALEMWGLSFNGTF